jgi:glyoxylase-like metal-dependent hydrolase (beta-lactamase superfamily II)
VTSPNEGGPARIDRVVTHGVFSLDGQDFEVDNNIWIVGNDEEVVVIDAAHDHRRIVDGVGGRRVVAIVCTHGHNDHINAAVALAEATGAPIWLHPDDTMLWEAVYPARPTDATVADGQTLAVGGAALEVMHTPGHSPGGCCLWDAAGGVLFSGDTLFKGGPGATGRSFSDFGQIIDSIRTRLLPLPPATVVHTGHGDDTTIGEEAPSLDAWIARGS